MSFLENTRSPAGLGGKLMVRMMNVGHRALARWGLRFLLLSADAKVLDCGCGGGANIRTLLKKCPQGIVKGVDISDVSVTTARRVNRSAIADGRCAVWQGSVDELIFAADWFDAVTAFETVYFWPDLPKSFREIRRVLRPGGIVIKAIPGPDHLRELRERLGEADHSESDVVSIFRSRLEPLARIRATRTLDVPSDRMHTLLGMTPLTFALDDARLDGLEVPRITIDAELLVGRSV